MELKYLLLCGDDENKIFNFVDNNDLIETCLNFAQSPSVGVLLELPSKSAQKYADMARGLGIKAGIYASQDKGVSWLHKVMNIVIDKGENND